MFGRINIYVYIEIYFYTYIRILHIYVHIYIYEVCKTTLAGHEMVLLRTKEASNNIGGWRREGWLGLEKHLQTLTGIPQTLIFLESLD